MVDPNLLKQYAAQGRGAPLPIAPAPSAPAAAPGQPAKFDPFAARAGAAPNLAQPKPMSVPPIGQPVGPPQPAAPPPVAHSYQDIQNWLHANPGKTVADMNVAMGGAPQNAPPPGSQSLWQQYLANGGTTQQTINGSPGAQATPQAKAVQQAARDARTAPPGNPAAGAGKSQGGAPKPAAPPPTYQGTLDTQFGSGNPFGQQSWYGGNPLQTAADAAQRKLDENLATLRSRYGAMGLGSSSRLALGEGQAISDTATNLGDVLAQRGQEAYQGDANRGLQALLGAGAQDLQGRQLGLDANKQLMDAGTGLTGIGSTEQGIPNLSELLAFITNNGNTNSFGNVAMSGHGK